MVRMRGRGVVGRLVAVVVGGALVVACAGSEGDGAAPADSAVRGSAAPDAAGPGAGGSPGTGSRCEPARPVEPGVRDETMSSGGVERSFRIAVPPGYDGSSAAPLLVSFHGFTGSVDEHARATQLLEKGPARGYVTVIPESGSVPQKEWNIFRDPRGLDDYAFVDELVRHLQGRLCLDPARTFAAGHSNGSAFAGFLSCVPPYHFAAVAMVAATVPGNCPPEEHPSTLSLHGTADPGVAYDGGTVGVSTIRSPGVEVTVRSRAAHNGCDREPEEERVRANVVRWTFAGCRDGARVMLYRIDGGGHVWPGAPGSAAAAGTPFVGTSADVPGSDLVLDFFDGHRVP